ncbi:MAG: transcription termination/antitermination NusG family protein [Pseudomonadota bacterium]
MNKNWYALVVQPRKEKYVEQQILARGLRATYPGYQKTSKHARTVKRGFTPLFPGYIFVQLDNDGNDWRRVNWVPGAIGLVKFGDQPSPLKREFVQRFIDVRDGDGLPSFDQKILPGDRAQAIGGPFDSLIGEVIELPKNERVKMLMDALNRKIEVTLPRRAVVVAA